LIVATSRFRVANGLEAEVRRAFLARARLVDESPGFLGLEVLTDAGDPALFLLLTRWRDEASFRTWHQGEAHRRSHERMPRGLKLDPDFTELRVMEPLPLDGPGQAAAGAVSRVLARHVGTSEALHLIAATSAGVVEWCSAGAATGFGLRVPEIVGQPLWRWLVAADAAWLRALVAQGPTAPSARRRLNFVKGAQQVPYTLDCSIEVEPGGFALAGEPPHQEEAVLRDQLLELNNELATALREKERARRALQAAAEELDRSHWHLKKIQEMLPICMHCGKVRTAEARWESVAEYLKKNSLFLTHGCCPDCLAAHHDL
jgi:heme-degrading monooxygenase HmoA